jgi:hypothetical protein
MSRIDELFKIISSPTYKESYARSKSANTCVRCGGPAKGFTSFSSELEYRISALCQNCQDECFSGAAIDGSTPQNPLRRSWSES